MYMFTFGRKEHKIKEDNWEERKVGRKADDIFHFFPKHMLRVSFPPGRGRACRRCWISFFWTPLGKPATVLQACLSMLQK